MSVGIEAPINTDLNKLGRNNKMYLKISNTGMIDPNALKLMGATTKRDDASQIGFFGTGNKYALAWLLKHDVEVQIYSGTTAIEIGTVPCEFGGQSFSVITVDGAETSLTTEMGPTWESWEVVREVYCNAIDAGDAEIEVTGSIYPVDGETHFYIQLSESIESVMNDFDAYFSVNRTPLFENEIGKIFKRETGIVYRHGIRCVSDKMDSAFDYDLNNVNLNENRRVAYPWQVNEQAWALITASEDPAIIAEAMRNSAVPGSIESDLAYADITDINESWGDYFKDRVVATPEMRSLMTEREIESATFVHSKLIAKAQDGLGKDSVTLPKSIDNSTSVVYRSIEVDINANNMLIDALKFWSSVGRPIPYPVKTVSFQDKRTMGMADTENEVILIAEITFPLGLNQVISTLMEEYIHIKHGVYDETRGMQDAILNEFVLCVQGMKGDNTIDMEEVA